MDSPYILERSRQFLKAHGGAAPEDGLLRHVFGPRGRPEPWRQLLATCLAGRTDLTRDANGTWRLAAAPAPDLKDYTVVQLYATGLRPSRQRAIDLALHQYHRGELVDRWTATLNPGRSIPATVRRATGLSIDSLLNEPTFADIAADVRQRLHGRTLVGHDVDLTTAFLAAELDRANQPVAEWTTLDTIALARQLLPRVRRPDLAAIATALNLTLPVWRRADSDALLVAAYFHQLLRRAKRIGATDWASLQTLASRTEPLTPQSPHRGATVLDRRLLDGLPAAPGVYLMRDARRNLLYVGKAKNLQDRVRSYYSQPIGLTRKMDGLLASIRHIDHVAVGSELEALLLETRLIRQEQPPYNVQQRHRPIYPYIKVDMADAYPRILPARAVAADGSLYFGPFRGSAPVSTAIDLLTDLLPIRTCTTKARTADHRWRPCLRLDLGQCLGPCVGQTDQATYHSLIDSIIAYLEGREDGLLHRLRRAIRGAAARHEYERAARLRDALPRLLAFERGQRLLRLATPDANLLVVLPSTQPDERQVIPVVAGRPLAQFRLPPDSTPQQVAALLQAHCWQPPANDPPAPDDLYDLTVIARWLDRHPTSRIATPLHHWPITDQEWLAVAGSLPSAAELLAEATPTPEQTEQTTDDAW